MTVEETKNEEESKTISRKDAALNSLVNFSNLTDKDGDQQVG